MKESAIKLAIMEIDRIEALYELLSSKAENIGLSPEEYIPREQKDHMLSQIEECVTFLKGERRVRGYLAKARKLECKLRKLL